MSKGKLFYFLFVLIFLVPLAVSGCIFEDGEDDEVIAVPIDNPPANTPADPPADTPDVPPNDTPVDVPGEPARISGNETNTGVVGTIGGS